MFIIIVVNELLLIIICNLRNQNECIKYNTVNFFDTIQYSPLSETLIFRMTILKTTISNLNHEYPRMQTAVCESFFFIQPTQTNILMFPKISPLYAAHMCKSERAFISLKL